MCYFDDLSLMVISLMVVLGLIGVYISYKTLFESDKTESDVFIDEMDNVIRHIDD